MSKTMKLRMKIFKLKRFFFKHRYLVFALFSFLALSFFSLCITDFCELNLLSFQDLIDQVNADPLYLVIMAMSFSMAAAALFWVFLAVYIVGLFLAKKPKYCPAIDCLNFNCGHFDRKYLICELTEVSGNG